VPRRISIDGVVHEFPDDATDEEISRALEAAPNTSRTKRQRTWTDTAVDALPMATGAVGGLIGATAGGVPGVAGAGFGGMVGEALRQAINDLRGADPNLITGSPLGDLALQTGGQAALEGGGQLLMKGVQSGAKAVYRGYLKPSLARANVAKASEIVDTAFREGLPVTEGATAEAGRRIGELKARVDTELAQHAGTVNLTDIANKLRSWAHGMFNRSGVAPDELKAALAVADRIDNHPSLPVNPFNPSQPATATMTAANDTKRALQQGTYGVKGGAQRETEKYGARLTREEIERQAPDVGPLNMRESKLIDLARSLRQATAREANRNALFGVPSVMAGLVGATEQARTGDPASATAKALALRMALSPAVATRVAILAGRMAAKTPGAAVSDIARAAVQAVLEAQQEGGEPVEGQQ
jgi:hypothetical protein